MSKQDNIKGTSFEKGRFVNMTVSMAVMRPITGEDAKILEEDIKSAKANEEYILKCFKAFGMIK